MNSKPSDQYGDPEAAGAESLGQVLRAARESRGLSLRELSDQTRISRRYLEAIESEEFKQLPGGIFNRSFVKAYARAVGVPEERAVDLYARALRERGDGTDDTPTRQHSRIYTDDAPSRPPLLTALLSLVILGVISLGVYAWLHYSRRTSDPTPAPQADNAPQQQSQQQPATGPAGQQPARQPGAPAAPPPAAGALSVRVRARGEEVWLRTSADGEPATAWNGILKADEVREIPGAESVKLEYARVKASALEVSINGRPAVVPSEVAKGKTLVEMLITKDGYASLLQQP